MTRKFIFLLLLLLFSFVLVSKIVRKIFTSSSVPAIARLCLACNILGSITLCLLKSVESVSEKTKRN